MVPPRSPVCAALLQHVALQPFGHQADDRLLGRAEFGRRCVVDAGEDRAPPRCTAICMPKQMPKYGTLRSRANFAARILPSEPRSPKPPGTRMPCTFSSQGAGSSFSKISALDPVELDLDPVGHAAVRQRLDQRLVGVLEAGVLADDGDRDLALGIVDAARRPPASAPCAAWAPARCRRRPALPNRGLPCDRPSARRRCARRRAPG